MKLVPYILAALLATCVLDVAAVAPVPVAEREARLADVPAEVSTPSKPKVAPAARTCVRYGHRVDDRRVERVGTVAGQRGVEVVWVNPPMRRVCVAWSSA